MKKTLLLASFAFAAFTASAQIPNGDFENWTAVGSYSNPDSWGNLNPMTASMSTYTCMKGTPGTVGASYLKLVSKSVSGVGVMPGIAATGNVNMSTMSVTGGFATNARPQNLTGSWQYMAYGVDAGFVAAYLTKWNTATMMRDTVATAMRSLSGMAMSWATFSMPFTYTKGFRPDSALIILSSSGTTPVANSYLYVDNLAFAGSVTPTGVSNINLAAEVNIYPNPASENALNISIPKNGLSITAAVISDMTGRVLNRSGAQTNTGNLSMNISGLAKGLYIVTVSTTEGTVSKQFTKL